VSLRPIIHNSAQLALRFCFEGLRVTLLGGNI